MNAQPLDHRMARLEGAYEQVSDRLNGIDHRLETIEAKIDLRVDGLDRKIVQLVGLIMTSWLTTIAAVLLHH